MVNADFFIVFGVLNVSLEFPLAHFVSGETVRTVGHGRGKKMGGGGVSALAKKLSAAAHLFPLLTPNMMHHSARRR